MSLHEKYGLKQVINAWGTPTLYGVSKAPDEVISEVAEALGNLYHMPSLERVAGERLAAWSGAGWGCITHCTAAAITLACAAAMTGRDMGKVKRLPDTRGLADGVIIQAGHRVNYGADMSQAISLSGRTRDCCRFGQPLRRMSDGSSFARRPDCCRGFCSITSGHQSGGNEPG